MHLCHCSTADSVTMIQKAKEDGVCVSGEVCPHHFSMTEDDILEDDANYKMNPPLRTAADVERLKEGLKEGILEAISTDHAPHGEEEKKKSIAEAPFGIVGSETAFALAVTELVKKRISYDVRPGGAHECEPMSYPWRGGRFFGSRKTCGHYDCGD